MKKFLLLFVFLVSLEMQGYSTTMTDSREALLKNFLYKKALSKNSLSRGNCDTINKMLIVGFVLVISSVKIRELIENFFFGTDLVPEKRNFWMAIMRAHSESSYCDIITLVKWRFLYLDKPDGITIIKDLMHPEFKNRVALYTPDFLELERREQDFQARNNSLSCNNRMRMDINEMQSRLSDYALEVASLTRERDNDFLLLESLKDKLKVKTEELTSLRLELSNVAVVEKEQLIGKIQKLEDRVRRLQNNLVGLAQKDKRGSPLLEQLQKLQQEEDLKRCELQKKLETAAYLLADWSKVEFANEITRSGE